MGKKTTAEMLAFGVSYAKKCLELEDKLGIDLWLWDSSFRFENQEISLDGLAECEDAVEAAEYTYEADISLEELLLNKYYDGAILCEGYLYEALYYYQGYGDTSTYGRENTKTLVDELRKILEQFGFQMDLSRGGTILLQCRESFDEEMKEHGEN